MTNSMNDTQHERYSALMTLNIMTALTILSISNFAIVLSVVMLSIVGQNNGRKRFSICSVNTNPKGAFSEITQQKIFHLNNIKLKYKIPWPGACTIKHYSLVIYRKCTDFIVSQCLLAWTNMLSEANKHTSLLKSLHITNP